MFRWGGGGGEYQESNLLLGGGGGGGGGSTRIPEEVQGGVTPIDPVLAPATAVKTLVKWPRSKT